MWAIVVTIPSFAITVIRSSMIVVLKCTGRTDMTIEVWGRRRRRLLESVGMSVKSMVGIVWLYFL